MILTIQNEKPAIVREDGSAVFHSLYTGSRYWGDMYNVLKDYPGQSWTVQECQPFPDEKDFSVLGKEVRYFVAECDNSRLYAALSATNALLRTDCPGRNVCRPPGPGHA